MKIDIKTLEFLKSIINDKIQESKAINQVLSDSERDLLDGKELSFEEINDLIVDLMNSRYGR